MAVRSKAWIFCCSLVGIAGSNPAGGMVVSCECSLLSGTSLCVGLITRSEDSYQMWWVCVCVCVCDREASIMRSPWSTRSCWARGFFPWLKILPAWWKIKKMSCLREMVAGSPAEGMPNGAAIKLWYWLMKIGYNLSMVGPEKILFLEQLRAGRWGMAWRGSCKIVREDDEEKRRKVGLQRVLAGSQPVREPTLRRRIASRSRTCVTFLAEAVSAFV